MLAYNFHNRQTIFVCLLSDMCSVQLPIYCILLPSEEVLGGERRSHVVAVFVCDFNVLDVTIIAALDDINNNSYGA